MDHVPIDDYVLDVLLPDLAGHDRSPAAFLIYIVLWVKLYRSEEVDCGQPAAVGGARGPVQIGGTGRHSTAQPPRADSDYEGVRDRCSAI
ncbi:MAG: hypothetical protein ACLQU1_32935 [Bryobacteraceae bacterium]